MDRRVLEPTTRVPGTPGRIDRRTERRGRGEPRIERRVIRPTDAPGFGVELDPAALA